MKKSIVWAVVTLLVGSMCLAPVAFANHQGSHSSHHKGVKEILFKKAHLALSHSDELGLSEAQVTAIRTLKIDTKKELIRRAADIEVLAVDITAALYEDKINLDRVNQFIDQKYALKAGKAKMLASAYANFKRQLTSEQWQELRKLKRAAKHS